MIMRELLTEAIRADGRSVYEISKLAGLGPSILSRYTRGERDVRGESIDKLVAALGKEVRLVKAKKGD